MGKRDISFKKKDFNLIIPCYVEEPTKLSHGLMGDFNILRGNVIVSA